MIDCTVIKNPNTPEALSNLAIVGRSGFLDGMTWSYATAIIVTSFNRASTMIYSGRMTSFQAKARIDRTATIWIVALTLYST